MPFVIEFSPFGSNALLIQWPDIISEDINIDIRIFDNLINKSLNHLFFESVIAYNSLTIYHDGKIKLNELIKALAGMYKKFQQEKSPHFTSTVWNIPVCYDTQFGIDLNLVANTKELEIEQLINLHSTPIYHVYFLGFLPGFPYLGGLDPSLSMPRLVSPRSRIAKGSVAIGANQTGIYPSQSPGGWNIIGRTPIDLFDSSKSQPAFIKSGDKVKFIPINSVAFHQYKKRISNNQFQHDELIND